MISLVPPPSGTLRITDLDEAWKTPVHRSQLRAVRSAAERLRERFLRGPRIISVRTLPLATFPYPLRFALEGAATAPLPHVLMTERCIVVQFFQGGEVRTLLYNPTDIEAARRTPYFTRVRGKVGERLSDLVSRRFDSIETQLKDLSLGPDDIDLIAFDNFQAQDLRHLLGTTDGASGRFPRAILLAPKPEWEDWSDLPPIQRPWFIRDGRAGVKLDRVVLTTSDLLLGDGVMLLRTPGRTSGNQTLFLNTDEGVWGVGKNGTSADNWSPLESKIRGVRNHARDYDVEVLLHANSLEAARTQYTSMILERTLVDRVSRAPGFVQMFPTTEMTPSGLFPGIAPTLLHRALTFGTLTAAGAAARDTQRDLAAASP
jgi:hypothetical protein